jgi:hypothetical protein
MSKGWYDPAPLDVPGGDQTQRIIEEMLPTFAGGVDRALIQRLMEELERTNPNSPSLARAKAALAAEEKEHGGKGK